MRMVFASPGICLANNQLTPQPSTNPRHAQMTEMAEAHSAGFAQRGQRLDRPQQTSPASRMFAVAAQFRHVCGLAAVFAAVLAVLAVLGNQTLAGRVRTFAVHPRPPVNLCEQASFRSLYQDLHVVQNPRVRSWAVSVPRVQIHCQHRRNSTVL
jgi:hypothetical protein